MFKVGTILHPTVYELNTGIKSGHPRVDTFQGGRFVRCLNKSSLEVVIATPHVLLVTPLVVPSIPPLSPGYILWVTSEQLRTCLCTVRSDCVGLPSKFTVVQL